MKAETKYFGAVEYTEEDVLTFPKGLFGFEDERSFLLIPFSDDNLLYSLQSTKTPQLSFILMHPFSLSPDYAPVLQPEELRELGAGRSEELYYYVLCAMRKPVETSTVNMRCPVAVNVDSREAMQIILEGERWHMRHPLSDFSSAAPEKEGAPC